MKFFKTIFVSGLFAGLTLQGLANSPLSLNHEADPALEWVVIARGIDFEGFLLKLNGKEHTVFEVALTDHEGNVLYGKSSQVGSTKTQKFILSELPVGSYTLTVYNEDLYVSQPITMTFSGMELDENKQVRIERPEFSLEEDRLKVAFDDETNSRALVQFYDSKGEPIFDDTVNTGKSSKRFYNLTQLVSGNYQVVISSQGAEFTEKISVK